MSKATRELLVTPMATVEVTRQRWIIQDKIPQNVITIFAGTAGIAKSTILGWYVARLTRGESDGDYAGTPVPVTFIAGEDDLGAQLAPRLIAAGANMDLVSAIEGVRIAAGEESWVTRANLAEDLAAIRQHIIESGSKLLIIDPIVSLMSGDSNRLDDVRRGLDPLHQLANDLGIGIVCVAHFSKGAGRAGEKVSGSHAFRDIARSMLLLAVDDETDERILTVEKSNYGQSKPSFAFTVDSVMVPTSTGEFASVGCARMLGASNVTVQDILDRDTTALGDRSAELIEYVNNNPEGVTAEQIATVLDIDPSQARMYLSRAASAGRIERIKRGLYGSKRNSNATPTHTVASVASVAKAENATDATHATPVVAVALGVANDKPGSSDHCTGCGQKLMAPASKAAGICGRCAKGQAA